MQNSNNNNNNNKYIIFLIIIILLSIFIRIWNDGELTGGDDSTYVLWAETIIKQDSGHFYLSFPNINTWNDGSNSNRFFSTLPIVISSILFGNSKMSATFPSIFFSILSIIMLFFLLRNFYSKKFSITATCLFATVPLFVVFTRTAFIEAQIIFFLILSYYLYVIGFNKKRALFFYLATISNLLNMFSTDFRGLLPLIGILPYIFLDRINLYNIKHKFMRKRYQFLKNIFEIIKKFLSDKLFLHFCLSMALFIILYITYLIIPAILYNDFRYIDTLYTLINFASGKTIELSHTNAAIELFKYLYLTPLLGLLFIPALFGFYVCIKNFKKPINALLATWMIASLYYLFHGQIYPIRTSVFTPVISILFTIAFYHGYMLLDKKKKPMFLILLIGTTIIYYISIIKIFKYVFTTEYISLLSMLEQKNLLFLYNLFDTFFLFILLMIIISFFSLIMYCNFNKKCINNSLVKKSFMLFIIIMFLINIITPLMLIGIKFNIFYRNEDIKIISDYLSIDPQLQDFSCIGGMHSKTVTYYTEKYCMTYSKLSIQEIQDKTYNGNLKYFVINLDHNYEASGYHITNNYRTDIIDDYKNKYKWIINNTIDITSFTGLKDSSQYRLYMYSKQE